MSFTEANTVEQMILDAVTRPGTARPIVREEPLGYGESLGAELRPARWEYVPAAQVPRGSRDVLYLKYRIKDQDLFDKAYHYIEQYY